VYRYSVYWVNTKKYCGAVSVDQNGKICRDETAPCYTWAAKKNMSFQDFRNFLMRKGYLLNVKKI
jgi:hypothetical protein